MADDNFLADLARRLPKAETLEQPGTARAVPPKKPSGPLSKGGYAPVEVLDPEGSEIVSAFLTHVLNPELCSSKDLEFAFRTLANATGRKVNVTGVEILKNFAALGGPVLVALIMMKVIYFPKNSAFYITLIPWILGSASVTLLLMTIAFRRQPDYVLLLTCGAAACMFAIAISSIV